MGKFIYKPAMQDDTLLARFDAGSLTFSGLTKNGTALYYDQSNANITVTGTNLVRSGTHTYTGTVTGMSFSDAFGNPLMSVPNISFSAKTLSQLLANHNISSVLDIISSGNDTLIGTAGNDIFNNGTNSGNDTFNGKGGNDTIFGSKGADTMAGGGGIDLLSFENSYDVTSATLGIVLNVSKGTVTDAWGSKDTFSGFEHFNGSKSNDKMTGGFGGETFAGLGGSDRIDGGGGLDTLDYRPEASHGGAGSGITFDFNFIVGGPNIGWSKATDALGNTDYFKNIEHVIGTDSNDTITSDGNSRTISGMDGIDVISGNNTDTVDFSGDFAKHGVTANLTTGAIADDGFGNAETYNGVGNIIGSKFNDDLTSGFSYGNVNGGEGDDTLRSGSEFGGDYTGGTGADTFVFTIATVALTGSHAHEIKDFSHTEGDHIRFEGFGAFTLVSTPDFSGKGAEVILSEALSQTYVLIDSDGDGAEDHRIVVDAINLVSSDFIFA